MQESLGLYHSWLICWGFLYYQITNQYIITLHPALIPHRPTYSRQLTGEVFVVPWPPLSPTEWSLVTVTTRATRMDHSQSGCPQPWQKLRSVQNAQPDGAKDWAFCSVVELQLGQSLWKLDLPLRTWPWLWRIERGSCPALTPVTLSVMALITGPCDQDLWLCVYLPWVWLCLSVANRWDRLMALNYRDKMHVVWLCWVFWMIHGDDEHSLPLGEKKKTVHTVPLVPTPSQLHLTPLPCGGQRGF